MSTAVKIIIEAENKASAELKKFQQQMASTAAISRQKYEEEQKQMGLSGQGLKNLIGLYGKMGAAAGAAAVGVGAAIKMGLQFAEQGAIAQQTSASFGSLIGRLGAMPNLYDKLRAASRGTVDDLTLQSSTLTLLAGTSGEFARSLANATPQLMEIAKAANHLNPTLGDTAFLYQSIATGIKRSSPMILDNLGLTIKIDEANQAFAASLGKTVEQLSATERQQALLNEVVRAGTVLIDQAAGAADNAVDPFNRMKASLANLVAEGKSGLVPFFGSLAGSIADSADLNLALGDSILRGRYEMTAHGHVLDKTTGQILNQKDALQEINAEIIRRNESLAQSDGLLIRNAVSGEAARAAAAAQAQEMQTLFAEMRDEANRLASEDIEINFQAKLNFDRGVGGTAANLRDQLRFQEAGGDELSQQMDLVKKLFGADLLSGQQVIQLSEGIIVEAAAVEVKLGKVDMQDAAQQIADELGISLEDAMGRIESVMDGEDLIDWSSIMAAADIGLSDMAKFFEEFTDAPEFQNAFEMMEEFQKFFNLPPTLRSQIYIEAHFETYGSLPKEVARTGLLGNSLPKNTPTMQATGGPLAQFAEVGEQGPEYIIDGVVVPAHITRALKQLGLAAPRGFSLGGPLLDGVGGVSGVKASIITAPPGGMAGGRGNTGPKRAGMGAGTYTGGAGRGSSTMLGGGGGGGDSTAAALASAAESTAQAAAIAATSAESIAASGQAAQSSQFQQALDQVTQTVTASFDQTGQTITDEIAALRNDIRTFTRALPTEIAAASQLGG